ncbi:MAG: hypothetical protein ABI844_13085 [Saprospiraceae bacterium]
MNENELKSLWQSTYEQILLNTNLIRNNQEDLTTIKVHQTLSSLKPSKIVMIILGILWVLFIDALILNFYSIASWFFLGSALAISMINKISIAIYIYHLVLINQVNTLPVVEGQKKLGTLKSSSLLVVRILILQIPFWTIFWWNESMIKEWKFYQWTIAGIVTLLSILFTRWLFKNIKFENRDKKWFKWIFRGNEWQAVIRSMELLQLIKEY